jgi:hypothetical protein
MNLKISNVSQNNFFAWNIDNFSALFLKFECFEGRRNNINKLYRTSMSGLVSWMYIDMKVFALHQVAFFSIFCKDDSDMLQLSKKLSIFSMMFYKETSQLQTPHPQIILAKIMENRKVWAVPLLRFLTLCLLLTFYKKGRN